MGTHVSFIFRVITYNPYIGGLKPSFFHGFLGSKGYWDNIGMNWSVFSSVG